MRVVIGEDQALMRRGLALLLEQGGFEIAASAADAEDLERKARAHRPDLVVADIQMPPGNADDGLQAALRIREALPGIALLVLSQHVQRRYASALLDGGAEGIGYLLKQRVADIDGFLADARRLCAGGSVLDPEVVAAMLTRPRRDDALERLTPRRREVLALMAEGRSNAAIGARLSITEQAVVKHAAHIYAELGLEPGPEDHRRVLAVVRSLWGCAAAASGPVGALGSRRCSAAASSACPPPARTSAPATTRSPRRSRCTSSSRWPRPGASRSRPTSTSRATAPTCSSAPSSGCTRPTG
jgi:DNA-binding NarL/FixJ family response regulator